MSELVLQMVTQKKKKSLLERLKLKYRVSVYNYNTLEEVWSQNFSRMNFFFLVGLLTTFIAIIIILLMVLTPLREFIPGYPDENMRQKNIMTAYKLDSMNKVMYQQNVYLANLKLIINGGVPFEHGPSKDKTKADIKKIDFAKGQNDSAFVAKIEQEEFYSYSSGTATGSSSDLRKMKFFPPLKGLITQKFSPANNHYGTDIVSSENQVICSALNGTVIAAEWTLATGNIIQVQHDNNLISIYKHNSKLLKEVGESVKAGEAIAVFGNSGELSSGPHLHFELWHNGVPLNPEDYIVF